MYTASFGSSGLASVKITEICAGHRLDYADASRRRIRDELHLGSGAAAACIRDTGVVTTQFACRN